MANKTKRLTESAMRLAMAIVLELVSKMFIPEMPFGGQIEKLADLFRRGIGICGGLIYRQCERFAVARLISGTDTFGCLRDVFLHVRGILRYIYSYLPSYARSLLTALSQLPG